MPALRTPLVATALAVVALTSALPSLAAPPTAADPSSMALLELAQERRIAEPEASASARDARSTTTGSCAADPVGDVDPYAYPQADVVRDCVAAPDSTVVLSLTAQQPTDPRTDENWRHGLSGVMWVVDVDSDLVEDYDVFLVAPAAGGFVAEVTDPDGNRLCRGVADFDGTTLSAAFDRSCIGDPSVFRVQAFYAYDSDWSDPDAPVFSDFGPLSNPVERPTSEPDPSPSPTARPVTDTPVEIGRLAGGDRYATAVRISGYQFPDGADEVYLARGDGFADALAGSVLTRGPILLVPSCGEVPAAVIEEARRLAPRKVLALGGDGAICEDVLRQFADV